MKRGKWSIKKTSDGRTAQEHNPKTCRNSINEMNQAAKSHNTEEQERQVVETDLGFGSGMEGGDPELGQKTRAREVERPIISRLLNRKTKENRDGGRVWR